MNKLTINVNQKNGITIEEAFDCISGKLPASVLSETKRECISGSLDSEDIIVNLEEDTVYQLGDNPLIISKACIVKGNNAVIKGNNAVGIIITHSNVEISNLTITDNLDAIHIEGNNEEGVRNTIINHCCFQRTASIAVRISSSVNNGIVKDTKIIDCTFIGSEEVLGGFLFGTLMISIIPAIMADEEPVNDCVIDGVTIDGCRFCGKYRCAITTFSGGSMKVQEGDINYHPANGYNNEIKNLVITNNSFENAFDATINLVCAAVNQFNAKLHDVLISKNKFRHGFWGVYLSACESMINECEGGRIYNVEISDNDFALVEGGCGEVSTGVCVQSGRADYYDNTKETDGGVKKLNILRNKFSGEDRGIFLCGADLLYDSETCAVNDSYCKDVVIDGNEFYDVRDLFTIYGAHHEGRRIDWKIGIPPHEQFFGPLFDDRNIIACKSNRNYVENVMIKNNFASGYSFKYKIAGAYGLGQGMATGNFVENVVFLDNKYEHGEGHVRVKDIFADDLMRDGGGNHVKSIIEE